MATDIKMAKLDPASVFKSPQEVLQDKSLSRNQKIDILQRWAYDERELAVAEEENMQSSGANKHNILDEVLKCLIKLGIDTDQNEPPPTKHG
ncbi:hypothetical protein [Aquicella lusitana]|uniref:Uncharacterized protein n=1 Tax=Aquicella lusitana TaxID=254246 RepID=A0A370GD32_9COXI|nr:hypothetical protein [Aquicella lusitana]RDI40979.1 hypothetical protein C8D86_12223 [Aquicella lusitana]VVC73616.1 hypothetical protein AQULUS_13630 [Aquicella lusitana]